MNQFYRGRKSAQKTEYNGRKYMSRREADDALWLDVLKSQGKIKEIQPQFRININVNGVHITTHLVDFLVTLPDGRQKFVETKGWAENVWKIKMKLTQALYPTIPYLVNPTEKQVIE